MMRMMVERSRRASRLVAGAAAVALAVGGLTACGDATTSSTSSGGAAGGGGGATGGTLVIDTAFNAKSVDPARMFQPTDFLVERAMYQTLLGYDGTDITRPQPRLARSWEMSRDGRSYTFQLDPAARFSDGSAVTSADVVFSFDRLKNVRADPAFQVDGLSIRADGEHAVTISARAPRPEILAIVTGPNLSVVNKRQLTANGGSAAANASKADTAERYLNSTSAGSGPYVLDSYSNTSQVVLRKNPNFWGEPAAYDRIVVRNVQNSQQQQTNLEGGDSQIALDLSARQADAIDRARFQIQTVNAPEVLYLGASRASSSPTSNPDINAALRSGIDYEALMQVAGSGAKAAAGIVPSSFLGALPADEAPRYDPEAAKAAVARSGIDNPSITLDFANDYHRLAGLDYTAIAQRIQSDLQRVGIKVTLNPAPTATSLQRYVDGETQLALWSYPPDFADPTNMLIFSPGGFVAERVHWDPASSPDVVRLARTAAVSVGDSRAADFQAWQRAMNEGGPFLPLLEPSFTTVSDGSVKGVVRNPMTDLDFATLGH